MTPIHRGPVGLTAKPTGATKMKFIQELTEWSGNTPNHIYLVNDDRSKALGYVKSGTEDLVMFARPLQFNTKFRKFREITGKWSVPTTAVSTSRQWTVVGSRGDKYVITEKHDKLHCSCSGFRFRGDCRHLREVQQAA